MTNILPKDKQIAVISALAEGSSIRSIERMTGIHRDTIMRLGVRIGEGCANVLDQKMCNLSCQNLQVDEIWGFIGKKERRVRAESRAWRRLDVLRNRCGYEISAVLQDWQTRYRNSQGVCFRCGLKNE